jgi:Outer membrane protein beta-barrel domain
VSKVRDLVLSALLAVVLPMGLHAQSAQRFSIQGSGLFIKLFGDAFPGAKPGYGFEAQVRYTPSALSFGAGFQYTSHEIEGVDQRATLLGGFFEPRYVFSTSSGTLFPYLSGRFYLVELKSENSNTDIRTKATGLAANGGGGVLIRLGSRVNADIGATYGYSEFRDFKFEDLSTGVTGTSDINNNGSNVVLRLGLTLGL